MTSDENRGDTGAGRPGVDLRRAMLDPGSVFRTPEELAADTRMTRQQKLELLRRWEYDATELSVAEDEGMGDGEPSMLDRIAGVIENLEHGGESGR